VTVTLAPVLFWADLSNPYVLLSIFAMLAFGAIGFADDYNKVVRRRNLGLTGRSKFTLQVLVSFAAALSLLLLTINRVY
jgi:phospho-N-acetylmuramoyl-pentapeptide-transferase